MNKIIPEKDLKHILPLIEKPGRYVGGEYGIIRKDGNNPLKVAVCYPDLYEIGMSNQAVKILYGILNRIDGVCCERVFAPAPDFEAELRTRAIPLYSLESGLPLSEFDIIAFSVGYELTLTNVLNICDLGGINVLNKQRTAADPIVMGGGPAVTNPAPFGPFFDCIFIGEAEEWLPTAFSQLVTMKTQGAGRQDLLAYLCSFPYVWNPHHAHSVQRAVTGSFSRMQEAFYFPVSNIKSVQDHGVVEIMRGCPNGCRFCHAAYFYRPQRTKDISRIARQVEQLVFRCGYREITLASLSSGDFPNLERMMKLLHRHFKPLGISFSLPSLRIDSLALSLFEELQSVRKSGLTFAVESAFFEGQKSINKCVPHEKTVELLLAARAMGWKKAKFYFMLGLPGFIEKDESSGIIDYISELQERTGMFLHINISTFVPKPHTPFQWQEQLHEEIAFSRILSIKKGLKRKQVKISYHSPYQSFLEGLISRGDERVGELVHQAFLAGARLDAWEDYYKRDIWKQIISRSAFDVGQGVYRTRSFDEKLPWQDVSLGSSVGFLKKEFRKSTQHLLSAACSNPCTEHCGVCTADVNVTTENAAANDVAFAHTLTEYSENTLIRLLFCFEKTGKAVYLSHLDLIRSFERAFLRSGYYALMSSGFNPMPKLEFASPLSLGFSSLYEIALCTFYNVSDTNDFITEINRHLSDGIHVIRAKKLPPYKVGEKKRSLMSLYWGSDFIISSSSFSDITTEHFGIFPNIQTVFFSDSSHINIRYKFLPKNQRLQHILNQILQTESFYSRCSVQRALLYARTPEGDPASYFDILH